MQRGGSTKYARQSKQGRREATQNAALAQSRQTLEVELGRRRGGGKVGYGANENRSLTLFAPASLQPVTADTFVVAAFQNRD